MDVVATTEPRVAAGPGWRLTLGDGLAALGRMEPRSAGAVITDPPWNTGKPYGAHDDAMPPDRYRAWLREALSLCARVSRDAVVFLPGPAMAARIDDVLAGTGLRVARTLTWRKLQPRGRAPVDEPVVWATTSRVRGRRADGPRAFAAPELRLGDPALAGHPCPKPVGVMRWLVGLVAPPRAVVVDPFAGTGATLLAALGSGRGAVGVELEERFWSLAVRRLGRAGSDADAQGRENLG